MYFSKEDSELKAKQECIKKCIFFVGNCHFQRIAMFKEKDLQTSV